MAPLALVLASCQIGLVLGIAVLAAPTVFAVLPAEAAGPYLRRLFPRYFALAAALGLVAGAVALAGGRAEAAVLLALDAACFAAALALVPRLDAARDRGDSAFRRLHAGTVVFNALGALAALVAVAVLAAS